MSAANILWRKPRLHEKPLKLGIEVSQATLAMYAVKQSKLPSKACRVLLENNVRQLMDIFTAPTESFRILWVFLILAHDRSRVRHFNVTEHPTADWGAEQLVKAFPYDIAPWYLLRYRDRIYGEAFRMRTSNMEIKEVLSALRSPWLTPYAERSIGSILHECPEQSNRDE